MNHGDPVDDDRVIVGALRALPLPWFAWALLAPFPLGPALGAVRAAFRAGAGAGAVGQVLLAVVALAGSGLCVAAAWARSPWVGRRR